MNGPTNNGAQSHDIETWEAANLREPQSDDFGDIDVPFEDSIRDVLPQKLRELTCGYPGDDHGHTACYFFVLAANEIDRLRALKGKP